MNHFLPQGFDPTQVDPTQGGGSLPLGRHPVIIKEAEVKASKGNDNNGLVEFGLEIIDGPEKGGKGAYRLNLFHSSSEKAVEIARSQLSALCHVTQTFRLGAQGNDLSQLFNKPFVIEVAYQKGHNPQTDGEGAKGYTEIKRVYDMQGNEPGRSGQASNAPQNNSFNGGNQQPDNSQQNTGNGGGGNGGWNGGNNGGGNTAPQDNGGNAGSNGGNGGWGGGNNANAGSNPQTEAVQSNGGGNGGWSQNNANGGGASGGGGGNTPAWGKRNN